MGFMRRKYVLWRYALVCERLRCEPWRPWGWGETTRGPRRPARNSQPLSLCGRRGRTSATPAPSPPDDARRNLTEHHYYLNELRERHSAAPPLRCG